MRMVREVLAPGVKHGQETDVRSEVLRVGGDFQQGFRYSPEQNPVEDPFILQSQRRQQMRQREDHVEVGNGQQFGRTVGEPLLARCALALGAMPVPAGVVRVDAMSATVAGVQITAENGCPAVFNRMQNAQVLGVQQVAMLLEKLLAVVANDIGHLAGWPLVHGLV